MPPARRPLAHALELTVGLAQRVGAAPALVRVPIALGFFLLALGARFWLFDVLPGGSFPFLTFFPAVLLAAWIAGLGPGLLAAALSVLAAWYWFLGAPGWVGAMSSADAVAILFFSSVLLVVVVVVHVMNRALRDARTAQRLLRGTEQQLRRVLDNLFTYVAILDLDGTVREVNEAPVVLARTSRDRVVGQPFWDTPWWSGDAQCRSSVRDAVERAARGETVRRDIEIRGAGGQSATIDFQVSPLLDGHGARAALVASGVDVSERVKALAALERSRAEALAAAASAEAERQLLDATFDAVPAGIIVADRHGKLLRMNRANEQIWGRAPFSDDVEGYREWKGWWADDSPRRGQPLQLHDWGLARALRGERCEELVEIEPFGRPGERRLTLLSAAPVLDSAGRVSGGVVAQVDMTARAAAERALRDSEAKFRALADNVPQLAWMSDAHGSIHWFNRRWFEYTGMQAEQMADRGWWRAVHHPDHVERVVQKFDSHLQSGEPWEDTFPMRRHDGAFRWFLSRALPVRDEQGRIVRWFGTNTDITAQMETERALRESEERLLAREQALREADRQKDTFLATLAHELRNPLAPIRSASHVIRLREVPDETVRQANAVIERQSAHLARLVDDLLDVSRITFGNLSLQRATVDLRRVIDSALETCRPVIRASGHRFVADIPDAPLHVDVDETRVAQCIANLVHNACKFTPPGGEVSLVVRPKDEDAVSVKVRDNGQGISREMLGRIFELFVQERLSGMGGNTGLGIGLALTRRLIEMHGGKVFVRSDGGGKGAEFEIVLPLARAAAAAAPQPEPEPAARPGGARILVVDDNADAVASLQALLALDGHEVFTACDGRSALAAVQRLRPDAVVLDIGLPDIDGYEVARRIRADATLPAQPRLVALTGWGQHHDRALALRAGFDHHLTKPADPHVLEAMVSGQVSTGQDALTGS